VFLLAAGDGTGSQANVHATVYRSDNGAAIPSCTAVFHPTAQVNGKATATELQINDGNSVPPKASAPRPRGLSKITPNPQNFPDAVLGVGVDPALSSHVKQFTIANIGTDCRVVNSISGITPFSIVGTSQTLPATLDPGQTMTVDVRFAPTTLTTFSVDLPVAFNDPNGDVVLRCRGKARAAIASVSFAASVGFGTVPVGTSSSRNLSISNTGEAAVNIVVPAAPAGSNFQWAAFGGSIAAGGGPPAVIPIAFTPTSEGAHSTTLGFTSNAPGSPHSVALGGTGCVARARIQVVVPPGPSIAFGAVQRGFRTVRLVRVRNTGNGPLGFRASVSGSALFGLQLAGGSITAPSSSLMLGVDPVSACGPLATGSGEIVFAVTFFANAVPAAVTGQLTIDNHNDAAAPASFVFPLEATIVNAFSVDVDLVFDRSGSMSDSSGPRIKIDTAIDAGRLFVQLGRPDVDDRIGMVKFNQTPTIFSALTAITAANQGMLVGRINGTELAPTNSTAIAGGVLEGLRDLNSSPRPVAPPVLSRALVVLTDGLDNTPYTNPDDGVSYTLLGGNGTTALPMPPDVRVYGVGIGDNIDTGRLAQLAHATRGQFLHVLTFAGLDFFKLEKHFTQIYMDTVDLATIVDPTFLIQPGDQHVTEFEILRGDVGAMVVIYDHDGIRLPFFLETGAGEIIDFTAVPPGFQIRPGITNTARFIEVKMPPNEPERCAGTWKLTVRHDGQACRIAPTLEHTSAITVRQQFGFGFRPQQCAEHKDPILYGVAIGVGSNFRLLPFVQPGIVRIGEPIRLNAVVSEFGLPVTGCLVTVSARAPDGTMRDLSLLDDAAHQDDGANDGNYGALFNHTYQEGTYEFTFRVTGRSRDGEPVQREAVRSKYVEGRVPLVPPGDGIVGLAQKCCARIFRMFWVLAVLLGLVLLALVLLLLLR
jgi:hypothetical protein